MSSSTASCAVRAKLDFWYSYLNAWELYSNQWGVEKKSADNSVELKELEKVPDIPETGPLLV